VPDFEWRNPSQARHLSILGNFHGIGSKLGESPNLCMKYGSSPEFCAGQHHFAMKGNYKLWEMPLPVK
jgi:hypothetical protein